MIRKYSGGILFGKKIIRKENNRKMSLYRDVIGKCCMSNCHFGYDLNVHHITPIKKGGTDTFDNYIVLCNFCHTHSRIHSRIEENKIFLLVWKFQIEQDILGLNITSDSYSEDEFHKLLKNKKYGSNYEVRTLMEESNV